MIGCQERNCMRRRSGGTLVKGMYEDSKTVMSFCYEPTTREWGGAGLTDASERADWSAEVVIRDSGCRLRDWDGIMETANHQEGEAAAVKIGDSPLESNQPADSLAASFSLLENHMFPDSVESNGSAAVSRIEPLNSHPPDVSAEHLGLDEKPPSDQVMKLEPEETETECQNNASTQPTDGTTEDDATDNDQNDSGEFVVTMLAKAKLEEQGIGVKGRSSPLLEAGTLESSSFTSHRDEDVTADSWRQHRKHVFVLSEAGKPIYSRYGSEEALSSTMGVMMALVSFVQSGDNIIRSVYSDEHTVVFLQKGPLVLVCVSSSHQSEQQLRGELLYVYYQIISMLTQASISRIFEHKKNYDLRRLLAGSEKILDGLLNLVDSDPSFLLSAVHCLPLASSLRDSLSQILQKAITPNLVFSILIAKNQLLTIVQERTVIEDSRLEPADVHLLLNLIGASSAFQAGEIWTPICLPLFNPDCYFYAYISYLDPPECTVCLLLLSTDKEAFYSVAECKRKIEEAMMAQNSLSLIAKAQTYSVSQVGVSDLRHFMYKPFDVPDNYRQLTQFTSPEMEAPYSSEEEKMRLLDLYRYMHGRIHSTSRPLKLIYHVAERETLLAWVTSKFELYTCFSPLVTKACAITAITKLLRWIKKEEDRLFIRYPPKYSTTPNPSKSSRGGKSDQQDSTDNGFLSLL
ncbi:vacuolar fusion protein MON1 homolog B isoform X1 [Pundamilia nyererei]|uniref:Vacuolar fusion protein MON1 homolog n=2 Tax=Pundamilia nyererei TaxID=303518 RepID=A0A9Y3VAZ7_9CICH|nr:PREDICTED: vacuolar fusion protein MON1 homolog B-like isoform X1 [Pundamilia nyererei]